jgi:riboflavin biosynthesis pyrimidine reductase
MLLPTAEDDVDPQVAYGDDARPAPADRPWLLVNTVASADGSAVDAGGLSAGLSGAADKAVFSAIRAVADVIVAGAATVVAEDYGPGRPSAAVRDQRLARGQAAAPRVAAVSGSLRLDPGQRLFGEATADARPLVLTVERADPARRRALEAVAEVLDAGRDRVSWPRALAVLRSAAGARVVLCEGGPRTVAQLVADDLIDELCVTVAPSMLGGAGPRLAQGPLAAVDHRLTLARVLTADGFLFLRYLRDHSTP